MIRRRITWVLLLVLATGPATPRSAPAAPASRGGDSDVVNARQHFKAGEKAFNAGDFNKALAEFEAGYLLIPRPGFLLNMAHAERRLGHTIRARELYQRYLDADPQSAQRDEVLGLMANLDRALSASARGEATPPAPPAAVSDPLPAEPPAAVEATPAPAVVEPAPAAVPEPRAATPLPTAIPPAAEPEALSTRPAGEASDQAPARRPAYKQWWFWAAVGVVTVGVTTSIILATRPAAPAFQDDGSLGRVGAP